MTTLLRPYLGSGLSMPLRVDRTGDYVVSSEAIQVKESLITILGTRPGERRMQPGFGSALHKLAFENFDDQITQNLANVYTLQAVSLWEPRVKPVNTQIVQVQNGDMVGFGIVLNYVLRSTNTLDNIVYPFSKQG